MGSQNTVNVKELHYNKILLHTPERFTQKQNIYNFAHFKLSVQMPLF